MRACMPPRAGRDAVPRRAGGRGGGEGGAAHAGLLPVCVHALNTARPAPCRMPSAGVAVVVAAIVASMGIALYFYGEYQSDIVRAGAGEPITVGPVRYVIEYDGTHEGSEETVPENVFVKIRIRATNLGDEETRMSGGQFYIVDEDGTKAQPVYGAFSDEDLLDYYLQPGRESEWTTQFDVPLDEDGQYSIGIVPTKAQSSLDVGVVCLLNC